MSTLLPLSNLPSQCSHCFCLCCLFDCHPVFPSPSSHFLTFLFNALCVLCLKCHHTCTTDCPSPCRLSSDIVFFVCLLPHALLPDYIRPCLLIFPSPCLSACLFLVTALQKTAFLPAISLSSPNRYSRPTCPFLVLYSQTKGSLALELNTAKQ